MSDTPRTDALLASWKQEYDLDEALDLARDLERGAAAYKDAAQRRMEERDEARDSSARWWTAASPYATPEALYEALKSFSNVNQELEAARKLVNVWRAAATEFDPPQGIAAPDTSQGVNAAYAENLVAALREIRDSTFRSAVTLRGMADRALQAFDAARVGQLSETENRFLTAANAEWRRRNAELAGLLLRIRDWDMMATAADGPYWRKEIDALLSKGHEAEVSPEGQRSEPSREDLLDVLRGPHPDPTGQP